jgi:hypothetical protein
MRAVSHPQTTTDVATTLASGPYRALIMRELESRQKRLEVTYGQENIVIQVYKFVDQPQLWKLAVFKTNQKFPALTYSKVDCRYLANLSAVKYSSQYGGSATYEWQHSYLFVPCEKGDVWRGWIMRGIAYNYSISDTVDVNDTRCMV